MIPTLAGRIQTRLLLFVLLGIPLTALFSWLWLPLYWDLLFVFLLTVLATVTGFGLLMDVVYIGLQRLRWDRDWPFAYQFFFSIVEFAIVLWAARAGLIPWLLTEALAGTDGVDHGLVPFRHGVHPVLPCAAGTDFGVFHPLAVQGGPVGQALIWRALCASGRPCIWPRWRSPMSGWCRCRT